MYIFIKTNSRSIRFKIQKYTFVMPNIDILHHLFYKLLFFSAVYLMSSCWQTAPYGMPDLCAKPLALTRSLCVFPVGIFPRFLKIFIIFKPVRVPAFRRNSPLKYTLCVYPVGFKNLPGKTARRFLSEGLGKRAGPKIKEAAMLSSRTQNRNRRKKETEVPLFFSTQMIVVSISDFRTSI